jgi:hypothetical protein
MNTTRSYTHDGPTSCGSCMWYNDARTWKIFYSMGLNVSLSTNIFTKDGNFEMTLFPQYHRTHNLESCATKFSRAISCVNVRSMSILMMETQLLSKTSVFNRRLTWLIARESFTFIRREKFVLYRIMFLWHYLYYPPIYVSLVVSFPVAFRPKCCNSNPVSCSVCLQD